MSSSEIPHILRLALPLILVNVGNKLMGIVDTILAGRIGPQAIGAVGMGADIFFTGSIIAFGVLVGTDPLVSQAFGAGRRREARRTMWQAVWAAGIMTVPFTAAVTALALSLERFGVERALAVETRTYIWVRLPSLLPLLAFVAGRTYLQAAQVTRPIVIAMVAANVFNLGAALALLPPLGVRGLGIATSMATVVELVVLALALRRLDPGAGDGSLRSPDARLLRSVFALGLPLGAQFLAEIGMFVLVGVMMASISTAAVAAHQVAIGVASLTFMVPLAVANATSVRVGRAIGAGDTPSARTAGLTGLAIGGAFMAACGLTMLAAAEPIARLWTADPAVVPLAAALVRIAAAFQVFDGIQVVAAGALRGAGLTRLTLAVNLAAYWFVALPVGLLLAFRTSLGPNGLWWGLTVGLAAVAVTLSFAFARVTKTQLRAVVV